MSTTLTAVPNPAAGTVALTVGYDQRLTSLVRTDRNGTRPVRVLAADALPRGFYGTATRINLVKNPTVGIDATGWDAGFGAGTGTKGRNAGAGYSGAGFYRCTWSTAAAAGNGFMEVNLAVGFGVTWGYAYTASGWVRSSKAQRFRATMKFWDGVSNVTGTISGAEVVVPANTWTRLSVSGVSPASTNGVFLDFETVAGTGAVAWAAGDTMDLDAVLLEQSTVLGSYFDGSMPKDNVGLYAFTGTAHASTSQFAPARGPLAVTDYEAASGAVSYTATDELNGPATAALVWEPDSVAAVVDVYTPAASAASDTVEEYAQARDPRIVVLDPVNRPEPLVIRGVPGLRRGSLGFRATTHPQALALQAVLVKGVPLLLRQRDHTGLDMYFYATSTEVPVLTPGGAGTVWAVRCTFVEAAVPAGNRAS